MKRRLLCVGILLLLGSSQGFAAGDDLEAILDSASAPIPTAAKVESNLAVTWFQTQVPAANLAQTILIHKLNQSDWQGALQAWPTAVSGTNIQNSPSGIAFESWLLYKAGLKVSGIETLWSVTDPQKIDPLAQKLWRDATSINQPEWNMAILNSVDKWEPIFPGIKVMNQLKAIDLKTPIKELAELVKKSPEGSDLQNRARWSLVLALSLNDQAGEAAKELAILIKNQPKSISLDLMNLTAGRLLYQNSYFDAASKFYQKVSKSSDLWLDAREELAWTLLRKGDAGAALAVTKDLLHPAFVGMTSSEVDLVDALAALRVCDYARTLSTLNQFSQRHKSTFNELSKVAVNPATPAIETALNLLTQQRLTVKAVGKNLTAIPRASLRDDEIYSRMQTYAQLSAEQKRAISPELKKSLETRALEQKSLALKRMQLLAQKESLDIQANLKKMNIVEAEVIERLAAMKKPSGLAKNETKATENQQQVAKNHNVLVFPQETELWFDEMTYIKNDVTKACVR